MVTTFTPSANTATTITVAASAPVGRTYFSVILRGAANDIVTLTPGGLRLALNVEHFIDVSIQRPSVRLTSNGDMTGTIVTNTIERSGVPIVVIVGNENTKVSSTSMSERYLKNKHVQPNNNVNSLYGTNQQKSTGPTMYISVFAEFEYCFSKVGTGTINDKMNIQVMLTSTLGRAYDISPFPNVISGSYFVKVNT